MSNKKPPKSVQIVFSFEESGTNVKVETKKDSKEVKAKATKTPKVTPPSNTTVEEMRGKEITITIFNRISFLWPEANCFHRIFDPTEQ